MSLYLGFAAKFISFLFMSFLSVLSSSASFFASKPQSLPIIIFILIALFPSQISSLFRAIILASL